METRQVDEARRNQNVRQGDPAHFTLKVLGGERLARLLERAREKRHYEVPWPVADHETCDSDLT